MVLKPLPMAPDRYLVSQDGHIYGLINSQGRRREVPFKLTPFPCGDDYLHVGLHLAAGVKAKRFAVHRLVCLTFKGPCPSPQHECAHRDGTRTNNRASNLRWVTRKENAADRDRHHRTVWGERATLGKLTEDAVRAIRVLLDNGFSYARVSSLFGVTVAAVGKIATGRSWKRLV